MASTAFLTPLIKEETDVPARATVLPKRRSRISNIQPRARFVKPHPNINVLASKDIQPSKLESKKTGDVTSPQSIPEPILIEDLTSKSKCTPLLDILPTELIKKESDPFTRPILPKRMVGLPTAPRARFHKPRPNIGALLHKTPKDSRMQEDSKCTSLNENQSIDTSPKVSAIVLDTSERESLSAIHSDAEKEITSVVGSVSSTNIEEESPAVTTIDSESSPVQGISENYDNGESHVILPIGSPLTTDENETGGSVVDIVLNELQEREYFQSLESRNMTSDKSKATTGNRYRTTSGSAVEKGSPSVNKNLEYPTLKSILNSPRKRSTTKKTHERKKRLANLSDNPSRSEMTMIDLIYWNPSSSPMKIVKPQTTPVENLITPDENTEPPPPTEEPEDEGNSNTPVPKVIINENGEIIIDESSLVVRRKETIDTSIEAVVENDNTTYASFRKRSAKQWTTKETAKFYKALSLVGTDFALMENIFTADGKVTRTRRELKLKFKREEKLNTEFVHRAMYDTQTYDVSILDDDPDDDVLECPDVDDAPKSKRKGQNKTGHKRKKKTDLSEDFISDETVDENDGYAVQEVLIENTLSGEIETAEVLSDPIADRNELNEKNHISVENIKHPRVQRMRKTRILQDFITDVDSIDDSSADVLVTRENPVNYNKKKKLQVTSVDSTYLLETSAENALNTVETLDVSSRRKQIQVLSKHSTEPTDSIDNNDDLVNTKCELSRSGRRRKTKVLPDFVTDVEDIFETNGENLNSDDESIYTGKRKRIQVLSEDSADESMDARSEYFLGKKNQLTQSPQRLWEETTECAADQDVVCLSLPDKRTTVLVSDTTHNSSKDPTELDDCKLIELLPVQNEKNVVVNDGPIKTRVNTAESISIGNLLKLPYSNKCNSASEENLLTDAVISEVVTSDKVTRRVRRKAAPNLSKAAKRPESQKKIRPLNHPSFTNFTPTEEHFSTQKEMKTYSRGAKTHEDVFLTHPHDPSKTLVTLEQKQEQDISVSLNISKNSPGTPDQNMDPPPVMIFTKSPNNENILHLFMVSPPHSSY